MLTMMKETEKVNFKIAQLKLVLNQRLIKQQYDAKWICDKIKDLNCKVIETKYLRKHHAEWIGLTALHFAYDVRNLEAFNILLKHGADFTIKNNNNSTVLHQIIEGLTDEYTLNNPFVNSVLTAHLKYSNFKNPSNDDGLSHFHIACAANNVEAVKGFLQSGVSIDHAVKMDSPFFPGFTPLYFAIKYCAFEVADFLINCDANVSIKDAKGMTLLHMALERQLKFISDVDFDKRLRIKNEVVLSLLLDKSNDGAMITDDWGLSDFHVCCTLKDSQIAETFFLLNLDNVNHTVNMNSPLWAGYTALHFAALCNVGTVKLLMKNGADINVTDAKGVTPFDLCMKTHEIKDIYGIISLNRKWKNIMLSDGKTKLLDLLFAMKDSYQMSMFLKKINKNIISICNDSPLWPGCSLLHIAVKLFAKKFFGNSEEQTKLQIMNSLCKQNPHMLYSQDVHSYTPLHLAFRINKKSILDLLISLMNAYPKWVDHVDDEGLSFAHIASAQNDVSLLERMLLMGTNINATYEGTSSIFPNICRGSTALHFAVANGSTKAVNVLITFGADVYAKDANDMTPIHLLLLNKHTSKQMADILLTLPNLKDSVVSGIGLSHLHVASWCDKVEVAKRLLANGSNVNSVITYQPNAQEKPTELTFLERYAGYSPLLIACQQDSTQTKDLLLEHNADYFIKNTNGKPLLYSLVEEKSKSNLEWFTNILETRDDIDLRVKAETGITELHIAFLNIDLKAILMYFEERVNVNKQILCNSPILPGFTPLHIFIRASEQNEDNLNELLIRGLLNSRADVTLQNADSKTVIHMAYEMYIENEEERYYSYVNMLLEAQRDFSVNPTSIDEISHFHIACSVCNTKIVEKFLNKADIDINRPIDYFHKHLSGRSALHLAASSQVKRCGFAKVLSTVDLLLKHGANVHAEDSRGETPLNDCAFFNSLDLFERLVRAGSDVNVRGICGFTPLSDYLESDKISVEGIKILLRFGCRFNSFNTVCGLGFVGRLVTLLPFEDIQNLFTAVIVNFPQEMETDKFGRTIIHNIVAIEPYIISRKVTENQYVELFEQISKTGCDIDAQDNLGRTALHMAAKFHNFRAISGLLLAGADVNIKDFNGNAITFPCDFALCKWCIIVPNKSAHEKCDHFEMFNTLAIYVKKLQLCGLDVNQENEDFTHVAFKKFSHKSPLKEIFFKELYAIKNPSIGSPSFTLNDFLSEYGAVVDYPRMSEIKRNAVNEFFSPDELPKIRELFPQLAGILFLQYRKAKKRSNLVELSKDVFTFFIGFRLPEICSELILRLLKNSELDNFIASAVTANDE